MSDNENLARISLLLAWVIALIAMLATLFMGEFLNYPVCHLCWYQRICMYPLVVILGIAALRDDRKIHIYGIPLAIIGAVFALYQYLQQMIPGFAPIQLCGLGPSCSDVHMKLLGFITLPFLSMIAFVVIVILLWISRIKNI